MTTKIKSTLVAFGLASLLLPLTSGTSLAVPPAPQDALKVKVNQASPAIESIFEAGTPLAQGTFSTSSAIKVNYNLVAPSFTSGAFGTFTVGLAINGNSPTSTVYPVDVTLAQPGSGQNLQLSASPSTFTASNASFTGSSTIAMNISCTSSNPCPTTDGSTLTANLQFSAPGQNHLDTSVKVQVNITLVIPQADKCLNFYNFLTDQSLLYPANSTEVVYVKKGANAGKVTSTTPFGQFSDNVMVANSCAGAQSFDLLIGLDPSFDTNPNDNPGNAVFSYLATQITDPSTFNIYDFGAGTPQGQTLCLQNIALPANRSFLATTHMGIQRGIDSATLPTQPNEFGFVAQLFPAGSGCSGAVTDTQEASLPYTLK